MSRAAHGHNPAAWTGVTIAFIGFCVSGVAMIMPSPLLVVGGLVVVVAGGVVGKLMAAAGMGKPASTNFAPAVVAEEPTPVSAG